MERGQIPSLKIIDCATIVTRMATSIRNDAQNFIIKRGWAADIKKNKYI